MTIPPWVKPAAWGALAGAVLVVIVGFSAGWVVTAGTAQEQAQRQAEQAAIAALTPVCVAQFKKLSAEQKQTHLAALQEESSWMRGDYIEEQGWATLPGNDEPNDEVANACAKELLKLAET